MIHYEDLDPKDVWEVKFDFEWDMYEHCALCLRPLRGEVWVAEFFDYGNLIIRPGVLDDEDLMELEGYQSTVRFGSDCAKNIPEEFRYKL